MGVDGCNCPPNEAVLCIFIALKLLSALAGFEPANLGSTGKHYKHYTTEADNLYIIKSLRQAQMK
jgi:hypothetical protein